MYTISNDLIKKLIESYFTEADSPEDFSMGTANAGMDTAGDASVDTATSDTTDTSSMEDEFSSQDTPEFDSSFGDSAPGGGLGGLNINVDNNEENPNPTNNSAAPTYRILGSTFNDEDDDFSGTVRIQNKKTGEVSEVDLTDIII